MKRFLAFLLAITMVFLFCACKAEKAPSQNGGEPSDGAQTFSMVLFSDDKYTLTALSYGLDSFDDYGLELKLENKTEAKANLTREGYVIVNGYTIAGSVNLTTEPGQSNTGWLTFNEEGMELRQLNAADIVELKAQFAVYLPDTGDTVKLGDTYNTLHFGDYSEDKVPAPTVGDTTLMDRDGIVMKLVKSEVDWAGDKVYYFCIENKTDKTIKFSSYSATVNGTLTCTVLAISDFPIPAGTKSVEKLSIFADDLTEIGLTPETVTSMSTAFRFISDDDSIDFTSDEIMINE